MCPKGLAKFAGPADCVVDDSEHVVELVGWVGFVSRSEVEDSADAFALTDSLSGTGGELGVDPGADGPDKTAWERLVPDAEERLEDHLLGGWNVEWGAVHFFSFDHEVLDILRDWVPGSADADGLTVVGLAPAAFEVSGAVQDGFEGFAVVAAVEADEAHSLLVDLGFDHVGDFVFDFSVSSVPPPDEDVGVVKHFLGDALVFFVKVGDIDFELFAAVNSSNSGFDRTVKAVGIDFE